MCVFVFYVTCNNISVIYVTTQMCSGLKKKLYLRSGFQYHRHFVGFFKCPSYTDTGSPFLYGYSEKPPHLVAFYDTLSRKHVRKIEMYLVFLPILLWKTRQRRCVTYDVIDELRRLSLSKSCPVLCHKLIYHMICPLH